MGNIKFAYVDIVNNKIGAFDPIVASVPADIAGYYFAVKTGNGLYGLVPDIDYFKYSEETFFEFINENTTGIKVIRTYQILIPIEMILAGRIFLIGTSEAVNPSRANPNDKVRVNLNLTKNNQPISGVNKINGQLRIPNSTTSISYKEFLAIDLPETQFSAGDSLDIIVELEVVEMDINNPNISFKLYSDPSTSNKELIFYLQVG